MTDASKAMMIHTAGSDDRETPLVAVQDLVSLVIPALFQETDSRNIRVYDPYYCKGAIIELLGQCGFSRTNIFNENKDCYAVQKKREVPTNDMLITNPPYSGAYPVSAHTCTYTSMPPLACLSDSTSITPD
jgi:hypothetical protein